jgi:hypothetical protein
MRSARDKRKILNSLSAVTAQAAAAASSKLEDEGRSVELSII